MTKVKICGLKSKEDIIAVNQYQPDYIGFVFAKSKRKIDKIKALELKEILNPNIKSVGVFVNTEIQKITELYQSGCIDLVQLHGQENEKYISDLRNEIDCEIIKAIGVENENDLKIVNQCSGNYLLFDAREKGQFGGTGKTFEWNMISQINRPYFLAGGLHSENVAQAITKLSPFAVDVSSHVETEGKKDAKKIASFIKAVRERK